eukprot:CAMPEP_0168390636 /NCGR_PEP_ID=MMETSP0228-20121227/17576_1 /TAXON_ID=133427 /ORGANISM="Protoceratium reticulatum, Strain CCCM 535 (=CCMP 1889)" /LENGTH=139 /DNA_ID=CAMNT_0008403935 /DNA_START=115 /DNA_END=534 /DNA_ORIENTATION=-
MSTLHVQSRKCRAQVPNSSCRWTHVCYKGGLMSSSCDRGICLCRSGMHIGADGKCHSGWWPEASLAAMNATQQREVMALQLDEETKGEEDHQVSLNMLAAAALLLCPMAVVTAGAALAIRAFKDNRRKSPGDYLKLSEE